MNPRLENPIFSCQLTPYSPGPRKTKKDGKKNTINFMKSNLKPLASVPEINLVEEKFALQNLPTISQNNAFPTPRVHESLTSSSQRQLLTQRFGCWLYLLVTFSFFV